MWRDSKFSHHFDVVFSLTGVKDPWRFSLRKSCPNIWENSSIECPHQRACLYVEHLIVSALSKTKMLINTCFCHYKTKQNKCTLVLFSSKNLNILFKPNLFNLLLSKSFIKARLVFREYWKYTYMYMEFLKACSIAIISNYMMK